MHNYKLTIAYDGTAYSGWQIQINAISIQHIIREVIAKITQQPIVLIGSGRTDSGVHALGQVAHFKSQCQLNIYRFQGSLNALLPPDIRVLEMEEAPLDFHAQFSAIGKTYHYNLSLKSNHDPFKRLYALYVKEKLDLEAIKEAAQILLGTHDFTSFANQATSGAAAVDPVRTLYRLDLVEENGDLRFEFHGDGFLYKMVRNIVGTLLEVGKGRRKPSDVARILAARDRRLAGKAAAPQGLFLVKVDYAK
jgi:tRNA pseudouridine38-40 synthase